MSLNQKFQLYQFQQTDKQSAKHKEFAGSGDEMNFVSMVEYQSLENNVRRLHVQTLQELRDFWQGVRNVKSKDDLGAQLFRIADLTGKTKKLYATLISRFPNSSNVLRLYARFSAIILADRDFAKDLNDTAIETEIHNDSYLAQSPSGAGDDDEKKSLDLDQKSAGSSQTSNKSREAIIAKKKREMTEQRLDNPIRRFLTNSNFFTILFIMLIAASAALGYIQIYQTNDGIFFEY